MQYSCPHLYELEKQENQGIPIGVLYHQKYKLSEPFSQFFSWGLTNFVYENTGDSVLVYLHYRTYDKHPDGCCGKVEYDFYIVENNGEYFVQYFNLWDIESTAAKCGARAISNLAKCHEIQVGSKTPEFQEHVRKCMSPRIPLDKTELDTILREIANTDFSASFLDFLRYIYRKTSVEMLDFVNKVTFCSDEYVLPKYSACVRLIEYLFDKCRIPHLTKCNLKYVESIDKAMEILVDEKLKQEYHIYK